MNHCRNRYAGESEITPILQNLIGVDSSMTGNGGRHPDDGLRMSVDGLKGFPEAINAIYPKTEIQQCVIHQIRNSTKFVSYKDIKAHIADLKAVYTAVDEDYYASV